ncbi:hypothetical protein VNI00_001329 [Paramarasmius palmivorus]|uniref:Nucleocapsid protein n=1 Tax=Paramarasmius palmivorus TaxID=297713 RepID=A0AAW0E5H0_9AGAR
MSKIPLPKFLQILTSGNVPVQKAMAVSGKIYKQCNTPAQLAELDEVKLSSLGVDDKELRKLVMTALRKAGYVGKATSQNTNSIAGPSQPLSTVETITTPTKRKRKRTQVENEFLPKGPVDEASQYGSLEFDEVLDEEILKTKSTVVNRAPLMTAWATVVAERMGFQREEALSIASVYTEMNALSKGVSLGIFEEGKDKGLDATKGGAQPYVEFIGRRMYVLNDLAIDPYIKTGTYRPLYQSQTKQWRALLNGVPAKPSAAFSYISRSFRQTTPHITGALRLLANSLTPGEINGKAWSLYCEFRPAVNEWGKRSEVKCSTILGLRRSAGVQPAREDEGVQNATTDIKYEETQNDIEEPETKRPKVALTLEEFEKELDEDQALNEAILQAEF